jgi:hypothetical protein
MGDKDEDRGARCLERGSADARVKSSFVNLIMYFFRRFTVIIYYIQTNYFIVQSVKKKWKLHSIKLKVKLSLCLSKHHAIKTYPLLN